MTYLRLTSFAVLSVLALVVSACATATGDDPTQPVLDGGNKFDAKLDARLNPDTKPATDSASQCPSQCTSDQDCQGSCGDPGPSGLYCCDSQTGVCYNESAGTCPSPPDASTTGG